MSAQQPTNYQHHFLRQMISTSGKGVVVKALGNTGKLEEYVEKTNENAVQPQSDFTRTITAKNVQGVMWGLPDNDKGKFFYHEKIEFKKP